MARQKKVQAKRSVQRKRKGKRVNFRKFIPSLLLLLLLLFSMAAAGYMIFFRPAVGVV